MPFLAAFIFNPVFPVNYQLFRVYKQSIETAPSHEWSSVQAANRDVSSRKRTEGPRKIRGCKRKQSWKKSGFVDQTKAEEVAGGGLEFKLEGDLPENDKIFLLLRSKKSALETHQRCFCEGVWSRLAPLTGTSSAALLPKVTSPAVQQLSPMMCFCLKGRRS